MNFDVMFPDNRESGENNLRQCQLVMLRMLKIFNYLCRRHDIQYFLIGGTLLGAIRHKGFIPWDDDLDVGMTRKNYEKFIALAAPELPRDIFFQNTETDKHYPHILNVDARLRDKYSSYHHTHRPQNPWHEGLQVDIFVHDKAFLPNPYFAIGLNRLVNLFRSNRVRSSALSAISKWSPVPLVYNSNFMQHLAQRNISTHITAQECEDLINWPFEDMDAMVPKSYHTYLTRQYGNYMQLPPAEKRVSAHRVVARPFEPCKHPQALVWQQRLAANEAPATAR